MSFNTLNVLWDAACVVFVAVLFAAIVAVMGCATFWACASILAALP